MAKDLFSTLKVYLTKISDGEHSPAEVVSNVNTWVRESSESVKSKIEEEVERSVSKMGFIKREEFDRLKSEMDQLRKSLSTEEENIVKKARTKSAAVKKNIKAAVKKAPAKKAATKKAAKK
jgi:BMFP domain-containing protein YqiC